jgi:hypothetical protein
MIETLNRDCFCPTLDADRLHELVDHGTPEIFTSLPVFASRADVDAMKRVIAAVQEAVALPAYREQVLARAPEIARFDSGAVGVFAGYDFHLAADGPRLIEINTNAGGALLNAALGRAQRPCCADVALMQGGPIPAERLEETFFDMFVAEWRRTKRSGLPRRVAIVDDQPRSQFLYPEFVLFQQLFRRFGVDAAILDPAALSSDSTVDLVYNRLTDFYLDEPAHAALREAYLSGQVVVTPNPRAHALTADKRNLVLLTDGARLHDWGLPESTIRTLLSGIPRTVPVTAELWSERRRWFFKPAAGHGSRAAYRGDKLTRRVWSDILAGQYVAQEVVAPSERRISAQSAMKVDVRNYVYAGEVQMLAARLYQGQTTNMRTPGGGFAPVLSPPSGAAPQLGQGLDRVRLADAESLCKADATLLQGG